MFIFQRWNIEHYLKRVLLYSLLTLMVIGLYFFLVYIVEILSPEHVERIHFISIIGITIIFIPIRAWMQRLIDRLFHREPYDPTNVISDFERETVGIYDEEKLHKRIFEFINSIFHFNSFTCLKLMTDGSYSSSHHTGHSEGISTITIKPTEELTSLLSRGRPFGFKQIREGIPGLNQPDAELVLPRIFLNNVGGIFICGRKKSGKSYSNDDVKLLGILTDRAAALFNTSDLYNNEIERQLALERERSRISKDLHDDIGSTLTRITMFSEVAALEAGRISRDDATISKHVERLSSLLTDIAQNSRDVIEAMSDVVWSIDTRDDTFDNLAMRMKNYAGRLLSVKDISYELTIPDNLLDGPLPIMFKRNFYLIFKEIINNIIKHSSATNVSVFLELKNNLLVMSVHDNGCGFDPQKITSGNGLKNMQDRADALNGTVTTTSEQFSGTSVKVQLKIP